MRADSGRWTEVAPSRHAHEREGLEHVREELPDAAPYHAWSNVEFTALDGTPYEVDLVVLGPAGLHLVELKAWSGKIELDRAGGENDWLEHQPGRGRPLRRRNPLGLTRLKAQSFRSWLEHHARGTGTTVPFVHESLFLHGSNVDCRLPDRLKERIFGREDAGADGLRGIVLDRLAMPPTRGAPVSQPQARALEGLLDTAGLRRPARSTEVGHWVVEDGGPVDAGWGWRDDLAHHRRYEGDQVRMRRWFVPPGTSRSDEAALRRAADREYLTLRGLDHPGLLLPRDSIDVDGPVAALVFDHDPAAQDLGSWTAGLGSAATLDRRLEVLRRLAEVLRYAHDHSLVHRSLGPDAVLVDRDDQVRLKDWQLAGRTGADASTSVTTHARDLLRHDDGTTRVYVAPEVALGAEGDRRAADVFSLGALAHLLLTGEAPAADDAALRQRLDRDDGLDVSATLDGVPDSLVEMIREATHPLAGRRTATVDEFLAWLDMVLDDLTAPEEEPRPSVDPLDARPGEVLENGLVVVRALGDGATSRALLVQWPEGGQAVLKAARDHARSGRLVEEASSLRALPPDPEVVHLVEGPLELGGRTCLLVELAGEHTLARELAAGERLSLDRLRRWGDDLINLLALLERAGVFHRDLKPANLGVRNRADGQPHLVLFDFSLASAGVDDLAAGTPGYRDPFLAARGAYDAAAEAWSAATVLHEMATGTRPTLAEKDGAADTGAESVVLRLSAFDPAVAEGLRDFFATALDAEVGQRFDNAEQMRAAWHQVFADAERRELQVSPEQLAAAASLSTPLRQSGLSDRAVSAVEQFGVATVEDLLEVPAFELSRATGASQATKDEVVARWRQWRRDLRSDAGVTGASVDALLAGLAPEGDDQEARAVRLLLGQPDEAAGVRPLAWPTPRSVADELDMDRAAVTTAWQRFLHELDEGGALGEVRGLVLEVLAALDGVATAGEVATRVVDRRGSHSEGDERVAAGLAVVRVVVEQPVHHGVRDHRVGDVVTLAGGPEVDADTAGEMLTVAARLGVAAEELGHASDMAVADTVVARLREVVVGTVLEPLPDARLRDLAAGSAGEVAVSARGELYRVGMSAERALRMSAGALIAGGRGLHPQTVQRRVRARFPSAAPVPGRPALDELLSRSGVDLRWDGSAYVAPLTTSAHASTSSSSHHAERTADLGRVDATLRRSLAEQGFLALAVPRRYAGAAVDRLTAEHGVTTLDVGGWVVQDLREMTREHGVDWSFVVGSDAADRLDADRQQLDAIVRSVAEQIEARVAGIDTAVLVTGAGMLARHGCVDLLKPLAAFATRRQHAVWLLAPQPSATPTPSLDGAALPLETPQQWLLLPGRWAAESTVPATA